MSTQEKASWDAEMMNLGHCSPVELIKSAVCAGGKVVVVVFFLLPQMKAAVDLGGSWARGESNDSQGWKEMQNEHDSVHKRRFARIAE